VNDAPRIGSLPAVVRFALPPLDVPGNPVFTIVPRTPLPAITNPNVVIDGATQGPGSKIVLNGIDCGSECNGLEIAAPAEQPAAIALANLTIGGFGGHGLAIRSARAAQTTPAFVHVSGCFIGTDASGEPMSNGGNGIDAENVYLELGPRLSSTTEGYLAQPSRPNVIGANGGDGVRLQAGQGYWGANFIGVSADGKKPLGNGGNGVRAIGGNIIHVNGGEIAFNRENGVDQTEGRVSVRQTLIHDNGGLGIDLGAPGPTVNDTPDEDGLPNHPTITSAAYDANRGMTIISGTADAIPPHSSTERVVSLFANAYPDPSGQGEGARFITRLHLRAENAVLTNWSIELKEDLSGQFVSATAVLFDWWQETEVTQTSEFSPSVQVTTSRCTRQAPALLTAPNAEGVIEANLPAIFRWTSTAADEYVVWVRPIQETALQQPATRSLSTTLIIPAGEYEWFVESKFHGCDSTYSLPQKFSAR
jgi:hypothetical protein